MSVVRAHYPLPNLTGAKTAKQVKMKIIFLDVDGVLNSTRSMIAYHEEHLALSKAGLDIPLSVYHRIDPVAVRLLNRITDVNPEVKYVISSTHRKHIPDPLGNGRDMKEMRRYFSLLGLTGEVIGYTPCSHNGHRGTEINEWLASNSTLDISHYVIIDDDSDFTEDQKDYHFVHTDGHWGFGYEDFRTVLRLLECKQRT